MWLLLQRLSGRADHVHLGAGHSHDHADGHAHSHSHGFDLAAAQASGVRWWGLVVLGVTGGLVPCWDAIILFLYFVGRGEFWLVLPALVCFSAGLAGVLVLIGILVVQMPRFAEVAARRRAHRTRAAAGQRARHRRDGVLAVLQGREMKDSAKPPSELH